MKPKERFLFLCIFFFLVITFSLDVYAVEYSIAYIHINGKTIISDKEGEIEYYHNDYLGNVIAKTDEDGEIIWKADYEPFGETFNEEGDSNYRFTGKELDDSGLYYYGARYYDKDTGRFISADSLEGDIKKPQTLNRYAYAINNPLRYTDPDGKQISEENAKRLEQAEPGLLRDYANNGPDVLRRNIIMIFGNGVDSSSGFGNFKIYTVFNMFENQKISTELYEGSIVVSDQTGLRLEGKQEANYGLMTVDDSTEVITFQMTTPEIDIFKKGWLGIKAFFGFRDYYTKVKTGVDKAIDKDSDDKNGDGRLDEEEMEQMQLGLGVK